MLCKDKLEGFWILCLIAKSSFSAIKDVSNPKIYNFDLLVFHNPNDVVISFKRGIKLFEEINVKSKDTVKKVINVITVLIVFIINCLQIYK